jgi:Predicted nucleotide-binding protein containing TIR-like domain
MPKSVVTDQELVVHQFAPLDGPLEAAAWEQVRQTWRACRTQLSMTSQLDDLPGAAFPSREAIADATPDSVLAFQQSQDLVYQAILRREHNALNLSVAMAQRAPEGGHDRSLRRLARIGSSAPIRKRPGWADDAALWARASGLEPGALLGEARLYLARTPPGTSGRVEPTEKLGLALDELLPYRKDRPARWWRSGVTTAAGYALWDTGLEADTGAVREIVLIAAADQDDELSAWAWSDRSPAMPPFARYLMHAAELRYEARLLTSWQNTAPRDRDVDTLIAGLNAAFQADGLTPDDAERLRAQQTRLLAANSKLTQRKSDMERLRQTVATARRNLTAEEGCAADATGNVNRGMFAGDQQLASYLDDQLGSDLRYLDIELGQLLANREHLTEALRHFDDQTAVATELDISKRVFVVYGRDDALVKSFFDLLQAVGLDPLDWEQLVSFTGIATPYLGEVVQNAPHMAQASLVLLSPDDIVQLHPDLHYKTDTDEEKEQSGQARPNVLFELGLAFMAYPERTIIVEVGRMRVFADLNGRNPIRFDGSPLAVDKLLLRLESVGCPVDRDGDWRDPGRFENLTAYTRSPTSRAVTSDRQ